MTDHNDTTDTNDLGGFETRLLAALTVVDERHPRTTAHAGRRAPHRRRRMLRVLPVAATLVGVSAVGAAAVVVLADPPDLAVAGGVVAGGVADAKGAGCRAGDTVTFVLDGTTRLGTATATRRGTFGAGLGVPASARPGGHRLTATCPGPRGDTLTQDTDLMVIEPEPMPADLAAGGDATVGGTTEAKGAGCRSGSRVTFMLDGTTRLGTATTTGDGTFAASLAVPGSAELGAHRLTATCVDPQGRDLTQETGLTVVRPARPEPPKAGFQEPEPVKP